MKRKFNFHHLKPKSRNGKSRKENLLYIKTSKHVDWHLVFGNLTLYEVIVCLIRLAKIKRYEKVEPQIKKFYKLLEKGGDWNENASV